MNYAIDPGGNNTRLLRFLERAEAGGVLDPRGAEILAELRAESDAEATDAESPER